MPMPILASVCWEAGFVWLCGVWVCGIPRVFACVPACACVLAGLACAWLRVCPCVFARVCVGGPRLCARPPSWWCVVAVSYSPAPPGVQYHWRGRA